MKAGDAQNIAELRDRAKGRLPRALFEYVDRGAEDEVALAANRSSLDAIKIRPRVLRGAANRSTACTLFGHAMKLPVAMAPTAVAAMLWHDGDVRMARAAAAAGIPYTLSTHSLTALEAVARGAPDARLWFQLYVFDDREHMKSIVLRARDAGYEALILTVDGTVAPKREYNARNGFSIPVKLGPRLAWDFALHPRWLLGVPTRYMLTTGLPQLAHHPKGPHKVDGAIDWETVRVLRALFPGRLLLKGILHPEDAKIAIDSGVDGIIVSNHGGRNLDASIATIDALPDIVEIVAGRIPVLIDGAFQRGSDIVKALALGASAVLVGRSVLWGVATSGESGVRCAIRILGEEIDRVMGQAGCARLDELSRSILWRTRN